MDNLYKIYEEFYINSFKTDSIQSKKIVFAYYIAMLMIPPAEKATEAQTETKQWHASWRPIGILYTEYLHREFEKTSTIHKNNSFVRIYIKH